jgi:hypothetical protein
MNADGDQCSSCRLKGVRNSASRAPAWQTSAMAQHPVGPQQIRLPESRQSRSLERHTPGDVPRRRLRFGELRFRFDGRWRRWVAPASSYLLPQARVPCSTDGIAKVRCPRESHVTAEES